LFITFKLKINYFNQLTKYKLEKNVIMIANPVSGGIDKSEIIQATASFAAKGN
jgi:hypothetical protein